jgi:DNA transposition AAA+ family ATPase
MAEVIKLSERDTASASPDLPTQQRMREVANECGMLHQMAVVSSPAGVGKTELWNRLREADPQRVHIITCTPAQGTMTRLLKLVQEVLGDDARAQQPPDERANAIVNRLRPLQPLRAEQPGPLLIFDESQNLDVKGLDMMRCIWEYKLGPHREHACGIIWSGNPSVARTMSLMSVASFMEFKSRIARRLILKASNRDDVKMIALQRGVSNPACESMLFEISKRPGHLRLVQAAITRAQIEAAGGEITPDDLRHAADDLGVL